MCATSGHLQQCSARSFPVALHLHVVQSSYSLDLHQLSRVTQGRHTQQRAWWTERQQTIGNHGPDGSQLCAITDYIHGGLDQIFRSSTEEIQRRDQIVECRSGLRDGIAKPDDVPCHIEWARTGRKEDGSCRSNSCVCVRCVREERTNPFSR